MRFLIDKNKPFLCSNGRIYPVEIGIEKIKIDSSQGILSDDPGRYSLTEVVAKLGYGASSIKRRKTQKQDG